MLQNTKKHFHCHQALSLPGIGSNVLLFLSKRQILEFTNQKESKLEKSGTLSKSASSSHQVVWWRPAGPEESQLRCFIRAGCLHGLLHKNGVPEKVKCLSSWSTSCYEEHWITIWTYGHMGMSRNPEPPQMLKLYDPEYSCPCLWAYILQLVKSMTSTVACSYLGSGEVIDITTSEEIDASASHAIVAQRWCHSAGGARLAPVSHLFPPTLEVRIPTCNYHLRKTCHSIGNSMAFGGP